MISRQDVLSFRYSQAQGQTWTDFVGSMTRCLFDLMSSHNTRSKRYKSRLFRGLVSLSSPNNHTLTHSPHPPNQNIHPSSNCQVNYSKSTSRSFVVIIRSANTVIQAYPLDLSLLN